MPHGMAIGSPGAYTHTATMPRCPADTRPKIAERSAHMVAP
jgi:hypothetical protein